MNCIIARRWSLDIQIFASMPQVLNVIQRLLQYQWFLQLLKNVFSWQYSEFYFKVSLTLMKILPQKAFSEVSDEQLTFRGGKKNIPALCGFEWIMNFGNHVLLQLQISVGHKGLLNQKCKSNIKEDVFQE